jgi:hypothetical protein
LASFAAAVVSRDLVGGVVRVEQALDDATGDVIAPKSKAAAGRCRWSQRYREALLEHRQVVAGEATCSVVAPERPFTQTARAESAPCVGEGGPRGIQLPRGRHCIVSLMVAAGTTSSDLDVGRARSITIDARSVRAPAAGSEADAVATIEATYPSDSSSRIAQLGERPRARVVLSRTATKFGACSWSTGVPSSQRPRHSRTCR